MYRATQSAALLPSAPVLLDEHGALVEWRRRRPTLLVAFAQAADESLVAARDLRRAGKHRDANDATVSAAVALDKSLLLSGSATHRSESCTLSARVPVGHKARDDAEIRRYQLLRGEVADDEEEADE